VSIDDPDMPLLYALRNNLGLHGPRFGCGLGQCGASTVHIDGRAVRSCVTPISTVAAGQKVVTLEGLGTLENLHPFQKGMVPLVAATLRSCRRTLRSRPSASRRTRRFPTISRR
jgi:nicotinate dehydrogenase subunit A